MSQPTDRVTPAGPQPRGVRGMLQPGTHLDAVTLLTIYLVLQFAIESRLTIGPLGGAGHPAMLASAAGFAWWAYYQVQRPEPTGFGHQPVRTALLLMMAAFLASFIAAMSRPLVGPEGSSVQLGVVTLVGWMGVGLLANDGVPNRERFLKLVNRLVLLTTLLAALGIAQFITNDSLVRYVTIPGLTANIELGALGSRSGFVRPSGTALSPIEFGAVITTVLPLAITWARHHASAPWLLRWAPAAIMGLGIVVSISRSALLCALLGLLVLVANWRPQARRIMLVSVLVLFTFVAITIPGMLGSLRGLFETAGQDDSVSSRTGSYPIAGEFFLRAPFFGRGYSTFLPAYRIFDNQYLLLLIEVGLVGLVAFLGVVVTSIWCSNRARRLATQQADKDYAQALLAGIAAGALGLALFDGLSFVMSTGVLFVMIGLAGALVRLMRYGEVPWLDPDEEPSKT